MALQKLEVWGRVLGLARAMLEGRYSSGGRERQEERDKLQEWELLWMRNVGLWVEANVVKEGGTEEEEG